MDWLCLFACRIGLCRLVAWRVLLVVGGARVFRTFCWLVGICACGSCVVVCCCGFSNFGVLLVLLLVSAGGMSLSAIARLLCLLLCACIVLVGFCFAIGCYYFGFGLVSCMVVFACGFCCLS